MMVENRNQSEYPDLDSQHGHDFGCSKTSSLDNCLTSLSNYLSSMVSSTTCLSMISIPEKCIGPVVRIGPNHIIVSDPESIRRVLATSSKYTRGPWFDTLRLHPTITNVISERDPEKHQQLRAMLGPGVRCTCDSLNRH
jgi:hypothetical protein